MLVSMDALNKRKKPFLNAAPLIFLFLFLVGMWTLDEETVLQFEHCGDWRAAMREFGYLNPAKLLASKTHSV